MRHGNDEPAVSPIIGVMLMIVVTIIIAAIVSAFAGGYANTDKKVPTAMVTCKYVPASSNTTGTCSYGTCTYSAGTINSGTVVNNLNGGIFCTHESGDYFDLENTYFVVSSGAASRKFGFASLYKVNAHQYDAGFYGSGGIAIFSATDSAINAGNQFALLGENTGSPGPAGSYLGWSSSPALYLNNNQTATFTLVDKESGRTISSGRIEYDG